MTAMDDSEPWPPGLHEAHCRDDRCILGCDCPCHRGEPVPKLPGSRVRVEFSPRYGVAGLYLDRGRTVLRVYPLPFVRVSLQLSRRP